MSEATTHARHAKEALPAQQVRLPPRLVPSGRAHGLAAGELVRLHHSLAESLGTELGTVVQFLAPESDMAVESVVYDLAYVSAAWLNKRVLFVNATGAKLDSKETQPAKRKQPTAPHRSALGDAESSITRVPGLELYQMVIPSMRGTLDVAPTLRRMPEFIARLRDSFDLVVIASPPASEAPMGVLLSRFVDGNVLVVEAGRTRAPVATALRESLSSSGGAVVGVVLTRYRSYVPKFLRRWL